MIGWIITYIIIGLIVGVLARIVLPGKQDISMVMTVVLGAIGALLGGWITRDLLHVQNKSGVPWIALIVSVIVGAALVYAYIAFTGGRNRNRV